VSGFEADVAARIREARTIVIETSAGSGKPAHRAIIWIVVGEDGHVFVRSWLGQRGRWYRELVGNPDGAVVVAGRRIAIRAVAADQAGISACSRLLRAKYRSSRGSLLSMLRDEVLDTTLELVPAAAVDDVR
jgi:hypothetical protein